MDKIPSLYLYLHEKLIEMCDRDKIIPYKKFKQKIVQIRFRNSVVQKVISELKDFGLIEKVNKQKIKIIYNGIQKKAQREH